MDLYEAFDVRRSVRSFLRKEVEEEKVARILRNAVKAPSAGNLQAWEFVVVKDEEMKRELCGAALGQEAIIEAPVVIVVCGDAARSARKYGQRGKHFYFVVDAALAASYILLGVASEGLGSVYIGAFEDERVAETLGLPEHVKPIAIIPIGYPAERPGKTPRMPLEKVLHKEKW